ncbi:amine acid ABC transporter, permease protein, 3-TM region, His/Glu/Gln/Arg/opine family [Herbaspirillum sp. CF444]|uniref:amino acid ABC transporter permease n=1 Tax=Herbaspirillum sp. CF444 TaxID=1144319 RepID=UPI0002723A6E|nr:amino acid ABC transporter permease [Herbaspirillum sp. CF444]EJL85089.1 amine acid ABC transporter, permease protein, 3-TM region, His/Glu/Gln/Arg/opine family [Herbaspirillum sp. CF444]
MDYRWNWSVFLHQAADNQTYVDWLLSGLSITLALGLSAWLIALTLGTLLGILRTLPNRWFSGIAAAYVELFRNVPLLVQIFIWYFAMPEILPFGMGEAIKSMSPLAQQFTTAMLCLGFFTAARVCEQVRSGIRALPPGQKNAGLAMGFTLGQTYRYVLLPMSFRIILPPLTSEFLNIFKNSAVASTIGLLELAAQGRQLVDYTAQPYEAFIAVTLTYMLINITVMSLMRWLEGRVALPGFVGSK